MVVVFPWLFSFLVKQDAIAIALWPLIIVRHPMFKYDARIINHERIHLRQQLEMAVLFFYLWYVLEFCYHYFKLRSIDKAYFAISFEKEAYYYEHDYAYLLQRKYWGFLKFVGRY